MKKIKFNLSEIFILLMVFWMVAMLGWFVIAGGPDGNLDDIGGKVPTIIVSIGASISLLVGCGSMFLREISKFKSKKEKPLWERLHGIFQDGLCFAFAVWGSLFILLNMMLEKPLISEETIVIGLGAIFAFSTLALMSRIGFAIYYKIKNKKSNHG